MVRKFPRTGAAAELVKQMTAFLLWGAAAYFIGGRLFEHGGEWWLVFAIIAWGAMFMVIRTTQLTGRATPLLVSTAIAVVVVAFSLRFVLHMNGLLAGGGADGEAAGQNSAATMQHGGGNASLVDWQPYSDEALAEARGQNRIVLVKFTATWCGNCQTVEATVFHDSDVIAALRQYGVLAAEGGSDQGGCGGVADAAEAFAGRGHSADGDLGAGAG